jgi:protein disulfide-isomerase A1
VLTSSREVDECEALLNGVATIAKMDADQGAHKPFAKRFGVQGFPSLRVFVDGKLHADYGRGGRTARHIVSYLKRLNTPAVVAVTTDDAVAFTAGVTNRPLLRST